MNLAEIRKKAGEARVPDEKGSSPSLAAESRAGDAAGLADEGDIHVDFDSLEPFGGEEPVLDLLPEFEEFYEPVTEAVGHPVAEPVFSPPLQDHLPVSSAPAEFKEPAPLATAPAAPDKERMSDPLARLLAGRESATGDDDQFELAAQAGQEEDIEEYLCFRVAEEEYALNILAIKEIIKPREVTEVPRMPKFIPGVISLRGVIIPIMDMRLRLSLPVGTGTGKERIVVLKTAAGSCGVLVDEVIQVVKIQNSAVEPPPAVLDGIDREFVKGLGRYDNRMLILLNLTSILDLEIH